MAAADVEVRAPGRRWGVRVLLWLPAVVWALATPVLLVQWWGTVYDVYGDPMTPTEQARALVLLWWAMGCALGLPLVGTVLAVVARSARARRRYAIALLVGCIPAVALFAALQPETPTPPVERQVVCQERSGGDTDCPGG